MKKIIVFIGLVLLCLSPALAISFSEVKDGFTITIMNSDREFVSIESFNKETFDLELNLDVTPSKVDSIVPVKIYDKQFISDEKSTLYKGNLYDIQKEEFPRRITINLKVLEELYGLDNRRGYEIHLGKESASIIVDNSTGDFVINNTFLGYVWDVSLAAAKNLYSFQPTGDEDELITVDRTSPQLQDPFNKVIFGRDALGYSATASSRINFGNMVTEIISESSLGYMRESWIYKESPCLRINDTRNSTTQLDFAATWFEESNIDGMILGNGTEYTLAHDSSWYRYNNETGSTEEDFVGYIFYYGDDTVVAMWDKRNKGNSSVILDFADRVQHTIPLIARTGEPQVDYIDQQFCMLSVNSTDTATKLYYELQERKGASCTNTTGTCDIRTGIHWELEPTGNILDFNYVANTTTEHNDTLYFKLGNYTGDTWIALWNGTSQMKTLAWNISYTDIANIGGVWNFTNTDKIDCSVGQRIGNWNETGLKDGNGCNNTLDVMGESGNWYIWYETVNAGIAEYIYTAQSSPFPVVNNVTLNSTTPLFYDSINCTAHVSDPDGDNEIMSVWANLTYGNGTVMTKQMTNWTINDWNVTWDNLDYTGTFNCNITAFDDDGSGTNQAAGTLSNPLTVSLVNNGTAYEFNNETYSIEYSGNFIRTFNTSFIFDDTVHWLDFNTSSTYTKYLDTQLQTVNNTPLILKWNNTYNYLNGTSFTNTTNGTQYIIFAYVLDTASAKSNFILEGTNFTVNLSDTSFVDFGSNITRYLFFNDTNETITLLLPTGSYHKNITVGLVNDTAKSYVPEWFAWTQINNGTYFRNESSSLSYLTVFKPLFTNCTNTNATSFFAGFRLFDEGNRTQTINGTFNFFYITYNEQNEEGRIGRFEYGDVTNGNFCGFPAWAKLNATIAIFYWSDNATVIGYENQLFAPRSFYVISQELANFSVINTNYNLYGVNDGVDKEYTVIVKDPNNNPVEGAVVQVEREYFDEEGGGTFFIAMALTNLQGRGYVRLTNPIIETQSVRYKFKVFKNNQLLRTDEEFYTLSTTDTEIEIVVKLEDFAPYSSLSGGLRSNCTLALVGDSGTANCQVNMITEDIQNARLVVAEVDILNGNDILCISEVSNENSFSFPSCSLGNVTGKYFTWSIQVESDNLVISDGGFFDLTTRAVDWGDTGLLLAFMLTISLVFFSLWHPAFALMALIISIIINSLFGFVDWGVSTVVWAIISISLVVFTTLG